MLKCTCSQAEFTERADDPRCSRPEASTLVPIDSEPYVGETPKTGLQSWLTPTSLHYVRNHFAIPTVDESTWKLTVDGHISNEMELSYRDILQFPKQTLPITMECAGNNRVDLDPPVPGNPFQTGAVSTAVWAGVPLIEVLKKAGMKPSAVDVLFEGADSGSPEPGMNEEPYLRSLSIDVATHPHTLLAYEMNGEPLNVDHGFPVRLIVPRWYGMASVKWLRCIHVLDHKFEGFFQTDRYIIEEDDGLVPLANMKVKSLFSWPEHGNILASGSHIINGLAWSGCSNIKKVEVSDDGGDTWKLADLVGPRDQYAWQQWNFEWQPKGAGHHTLMLRAEDEDGNAQPSEPDWNRLGYAINGTQSVCVMIRD